MTNMSQLNTLYKKQIDVIDQLVDESLEDHDERKSRDQLVELLTKPDLGIYQRARCNYLLAQLVYPETAAKTYANKALELLDVLRQRSGEVFSNTDRAEVTKLENWTKELLRDFEISRLDKAKQGSEAEPAQDTTEQSAQDSE